MPRKHYIQEHPKFGWCMDGHHENCRKSYVDWNKVERKCGCGCHSGE